jgi:hypothetical protein
MDRLAKEILEEVKANPGRNFRPKDLSYLQSIADVQMQMMWLYENGYVSGEVNPPSNPSDASSITIKFIVYHS